MSVLEELIRSKVSVDPSDLQYVNSKIQIKEFSKNEIILRQGDIENYLSFIERGVARYYLIDANGKETSLLFALSGWFLGEISSFISRTPSFCFIETLTPVSLQRIYYEDLQGIYKNVKHGDKFGRLIMEEIYLRKAQRERSLLTQTAEQRYLDLNKYHPHILKEIPLKFVASYIGVTPQALSRIRKRIN